MFEQELQSPQYSREGEFPAPNRKMADVALRGYGLTDARRGAIMLVVMLLSFALWYVLLPLLQSAILPAMPDGQDGPWLVRPARELRILASAFLSAALLPLLSVHFRRAWKEQDRVEGSRYDPFHGRPWRKARVWLAGSVLLFIYGACVPFYLYSWHTVSANGIERRSPLGGSRHAFAQIHSLEMIPPGTYSKAFRKYGPWYHVEFVDGAEFNFDRGNEGSAPSELAAIARYIARQSGKTWRTAPDARKK
jgi:hypothetical protein